VRLAFGLLWMEQMGIYTELIDIIVGLDKDGETHFDFFLGKNG
jgi:hypothetical protein